MSYITEADIERFAVSPEGMATKSNLLKFSAPSAKISVFLSHSHLDKDLVEGLIEMLAYYADISIYVDWQDSTMPNTTNRETANRIKDKIIALDYFLIFATKNALNSRWVPWEIGIADAKKPNDKIAIIPVIKANEQFTGNEYLQLYQKIMPTQSNTLGVFTPNQTRGPSIANWMKK